MKKNDDIIIPEFDDINSIEIEKEDDNVEKAEEKQQTRKKETDTQSKEVSGLKGEEVINSLGQLKNAVISILDHIGLSQNNLDRIIGAINEGTAELESLITSFFTGKRIKHYFGKGGVTNRTIKDGVLLINVINHQLKYYTKLLKKNRPFVNNQNFATMGNVTITNKTLDRLEELFSAYNEIASKVNSYQWLNEKEHLKLARAMDNFESSIIAYKGFGFKVVMNGKSFSELTKRLAEVK